MFLLIDAGNSRIKFGCHDGRAWLKQGVLATPAQLSQTLPQDFHPKHIVLSSVAAASVSMALQDELTHLGASIERLIPSESRCGLRCAYATPSRLGPDRWAAAIGAWQHIGNHCLVVSAGTATTIDVIRAPGTYEGGSILPGLEMMLSALSQGTAALPTVGSTAPATLLDQPARDTITAIQAGCLHAQIGAIERMATLLPPGSPILMTGGNAHLIATHLSTAIVLPWLIMDGLLEIAKNPPAKPTFGENP